MPLKEKGYSGSSMAEKKRAYRKNIYPLYWAKCLVWLKLWRRRYRDLIDELRDRDSALSQALDSWGSDFFKERIMAYTYVRLGERQRAKRYLNTILQSNKEEAYTLLLHAYLDLGEENTQQALFKYSVLLQHPKLGSFVQRIIKAIETSENPYTLVLEKPISFFYRPEPLGFFVISKFFATVLLQIPLYYIARRMFFQASAGESSISRAGIIIRGLGTWLIVLLFLWFLFSIVFISSETSAKLGKEAGEASFSSGNTLSIKRSWAFLRKKFDGFFAVEKKTLDEIEFLSLDDAGLEEEEQEHSSQGNPSYKEEYTRLFEEMKRALIRKERNSPNNFYLAYNKALSLSPPFSVLEQYKLLLPFVEEPDFLGFQNGNALESLYKEPLLFVGTYWKLIGEVVDVSVQSEGLGVLLKLIDENQGHNKTTNSKIHRAIIHFKDYSVFPLNGEELLVFARFRSLNNNQAFMQGLVFQIQAAEPGK